MDRMKIVYKKLDELKPYENNPRFNDEAVPAVMASIQEFGFKVPIIIDKNNEIVCGHTRLKSAEKLGLEKVPCIVADDLSKKQIDAFRLADNKTSEAATWDMDKLQEELKNIVDIDMSLFGFGEESTFAEDITTDDKYTMAVNIPQYEITGDCPKFEDMIDEEKSNELIEEIEASGVTDEEKHFLIEAAKRHTVFNYRNIAEYYAHAEPEMQRLMEKSALVIIDVDNAIANGYCRLNSEILEMVGNEE